MTRIVATATALPKYRLSQEEIQSACRRVFRDHPELGKLVAVFKNSGVEERYFAFPLDYYLNGHTFAQRNFDYIREARRLGALVVHQALEQARCSARDIDQFYFVTTTGLATPSVDALLVSDLGFRRNVLRIPLFGLGCAGGAAALGRAAQGVKGRTLVLSIELCGQTFRNIDRSTANWVGAALFGDGAAAVVLDEKGNGPEIFAWGSELFKGTRRLMGWDFMDDGFKLVLSKTIPQTIPKHVIPALKRFLKREALSFSNIQHFLLHPGGAKILNAYQEMIGADMRRMRESLKRVGNLSSAHVLFLLHDLMESQTPKSGDLGLLASVGPGFAMEATLLRW